MPKLTDSQLVILSAAARPPGRYGPAAPQVAQGRTNSLSELYPQRLAVGRDHRYHL